MLLVSGVGGYLQKVAYIYKLINDLIFIIS